MAVKYIVSPADTQAVLVALKVVFRPGTDLKEMQNNLKYEKA
jgi:hypothetical protein